MYESDSTCTLMINEPQADIQVSLDATTGTDLAPAVRARLSRKLLNVEISTATGTRSSGGEWSQKVLFWSGRGTGIGAEELRRLSPRERRVMQILNNFLPIVDRVEDLRDPRSASKGPIVMDIRKAATAPSRKRPVEHSDVGSSPEYIPDRLVTRKRSAAVFSPERKHEAHSTAADGPGLLAELTISARPRLASPVARTTPTTRKASSTVVNSRPQSAVPREWAAEKYTPSRVSFKADVLGGAPAPGVDMRFLPFVGWCIRFGDGAGTFRIMFFDGAVLEISVDDEHVEFMPRDGNIEK
jgi:hypothetical protein